MKNSSCFLLIGAILIILLVIFLPVTPVQSQQNQNTCQVYYNKAIELAEKGAEDLPEGQTPGFDPRIAKSKASIAYSQIYQNCVEKRGRN